MLSVEFFEGADVKFWAQMPRCSFWVKKYRLFNDNEILHVSYFEVADFKPDILFLWFLAA